MSYAMLNFDVKFSFMCIMSTVYGKKMAVQPSVVFPDTATRMRRVMFGNFPLTCCLLSEIYDNVRHT